jgi:glycosyltransferase involved in cell wall biosynthesis
MKTALIIGRKNGAGLDQDAALVAAVLHAQGWSVSHFGPREWRGLFRRRVDVVIHLERVFPLWRWKARQHLIIPNQERFPTRHISRLRMVDHILCKSRHALDVFSKLHPSVHFIGFTSNDRQLPEITPDYQRFFHLAGRSTLKGTEATLAAWRAHPEWPQLVLVQHPDNAPASVPDNVTLISRVVGDGELKELQNRCGVHLCPSLSEGWGHYIVEAMSCRAVVVTTDGPPMNELIGPDRGVVVPPVRTEPRHLGINYHVDEPSLAVAVEKVLALNNEQKKQTGDAARRWFEANDRAFSHHLSRVLTELMR